MDLVDDEDAVFSYLRRYIDLFGNGADVVDAVVGGGVEFHEVERVAAVYGAAGFALAAGFAVGCGRETVDRAGENTGARSLADAARAAEKISVRQTPRGDRSLERRGQVLLPHDAVESRGSVLARADYVLVTHIN